MTSFDVLEWICDVLRKDSSIPDLINGEDGRRIAKLIQMYGNVHYAQGFEEGIRCAGIKPGEKNEPTI